MLLSWRVAFSCATEMEPSPSKTLNAAPTSAADGMLRRKVARALATAICHCALTGPTLVTLVLGTPLRA